MWHEGTASALDWFAWKRWLCYALCWILGYPCSFSICMLRMTLKGLAHTHMLASAQHPKPLAYCIHQAQKYQNAYETHLSAWYMHFMACRMPFSSIIFMWIGLNLMAPFRGKKLCLSHLGTPGMAASPFAVLHHTPQGTSAETCRCDAIIWHYMTLLIDIIILYAYMTYMAWLMHDIALVVNTFRPFKSWTCLHPLQLRFGRGMCHLGQNGLLWLRKGCHIPRTHLVIATWSPERKTSKFLSPMTKACWLLFEPMNL